MIKVKEARHVARMGAKRNAYRILVGKPAGKRPLGRTRRRGMCNVKTDLRWIGWGGMDWIDLAQDREQWRAVLKTIMNLGEFLSNCIIGGFSGRAQLHEVSYLYLSLL
jgi:hypothetical protein